MADTFILGKSELNIDGPEKIAGRAKYAIDMSLPGMLHAKLLRSPHAHARLISIDASRARALPGVNGAYRAQATFFVLTAVRPAAVLVGVLRSALASVPDVYAAASALPNRAGAWVRVLARDAIGLRSALHAAWAGARAEITGQAPAARRK